MCIFEVFDDALGLAAGVTTDRIGPSTEDRRKEYVECALCGYYVLSHTWLYVYYTFSYACIASMPAHKAPMALNSYKNTKNYPPSAENNKEQKQCNEWECAGRRHNMSTAIKQNWMLILCTTIKCNIAEDLLSSCANDDDWCIRSSRAIWRAYVFSNRTHTQCTHTTHTYAFHTRAQTAKH